MILLSLLACDGEGLAGLGGDEDAGEVVSIRIEPDEIRLETGDDEAAEVEFVAVAAFGDGSEAEIDLVAWESSNHSAGTIDDDGAFTSKTTNGGVTTITANHVGIEGAATVTVVYVDDVVNGDLPGIASAFKSATASDGGPEIEYPSDGLRVPRNLDGLSFFWRPDNDVVSRLRLQSAITDISVYTQGDDWTLDSSIWERIAASNREGDVAVTVTSGTWDGSTLGDVRTGSELSLVVNRFDARGSVVYWSTADRAIMRIPFGELDPAVFYEPTQGANCVGCHVLSNERDRMVVTHDGINGVFEVIDVSNPDEPIEEVGTDDNERVTFKAMHPEGSYMVASGGGELHLYQLWDGALVKTYSSGDFITQPDFHPDGDELVAVRVTTGVRDEFNFEYGEIVQASFDVETGELGDWDVIVASDGVNNRYYPTYSPDGAWIAYNKAPGRAYANLNARLAIAKSDGSFSVDLNNANGSDENMQNSWPRWGPLPDDDVLWLAFSSRSHYPGQTNEVKPPQLWVSGIDENLAEQGIDPSSAPFWLPGQDTDSDNHVPFWWEK